ncbi:MAG TPA: cytochrome c [Acidobacteriota bacterium]
MATRIVLCTLLTLSLGCSAGQAKEYSEAERQQLQALYKKQCAPCHGEDGKGQTPAGKMLKARNHTDPEWQKSVTDEQLIESITNGTGNMPKWGDKLSAEQIRGLVEVVVRGLSGQ